jgi:hypothetical protein
MTKRRRTLNEFYSNTVFDRQKLSHQSFDPFTNYTENEVNEQNE